MNVKEAIIGRRSVRSFLQKPIADEVLTDICDTARLYASGGNKQPIRMKILNDRQTCEKVFPYTHWAAYIRGFELPADQQPAAYVLLAADPKLNAQFDLGAISTSIMLLAKENGLETCCIGNFERSKVAEVLGLNTEAYAPLLLIALGYSNQQNRVEPLTDTIKYRLEDGSYIVPKYDLKDILI